LAPNKSICFPVSSNGRVKPNTQDSAQTACPSFCGKKYVYNFSHSLLFVVYGHDFPFLSHREKECAPKYSGDE